MPPEVLAFDINLASQLQTNQHLTENISGENLKTVPGIFDKLVSEYSQKFTQNNKSENILSSGSYKQENFETSMTFKNNSSVSNSILDLLISRNQNEPEFIETENNPKEFLNLLKFLDSYNFNSENDENSEILNNIPEFDNLIQKFENLPDETQEIIKYITSEIVEEYKSIEKPEQTQELIKNFVDNLVEKIKNIDSESYNVQNIVQQENSEEIENLISTKIEDLPEQTQELIKNFVDNLVEKIKNIDSESDNVQNVVQEKNSEKIENLNSTKIEDLPEQTKEFIKNFVDNLVEKVKNIDSESEDVQNVVQQENSEEVENLISTKIEDLPEQTKEFIKNFVDNLVEKIKNIDSESDNVQNIVQQKNSEDLSVGKNINSKIETLTKEIKALVKENNNENIIEQNSENSIENNSDENEIVKFILDDDDNLIQKFENLPDEAKKEIKRVVVELIVDSSKTEKEIATDNKISEVPNEDKKDDEPEEIEFEIVKVNLAGAAAVQNNNSVVENSVQKNEISENNSKTQEINNQNQKDQKISVFVKSQDLKTETENKNDEVEEKNDETKTSEKFREIINRSSERKDDNENDDGNKNFQNQEQNFGRSNDGYFSSRRNRNESRRVSNDSTRTRNERLSSYTAPRRNESHHDFQNFFEGVLNNRRNSSLTSSVPLNLRANYNFSQSGLLRDGLLNVVRFIRADGIQKANVIIDPPALGRISVELTSTASGIEASIKVSSEQVRQLVQDQLSQLRMNLSQQGVQVTEFTVDVQQDNTNQQQNSQNENQNNRQRIEALTDENEDESEEFRVDLEEGLLYWVA